MSGCPRRAACAGSRARPVPAASGRESARRRRRRPPATALRVRPPRGRSVSPPRPALCAGSPPVGGRLRSRVRAWAGHPKVSGQRPAVGFTSSACYRESHRATPGERPPAAMGRRGERCWSGISRGLIAAGGRSHKRSALGNGGGWPQAASGTAMNIGRPSFSIRSMTALRLAATAARTASYTCAGESTGWPPTIEIRLPDSTPASAAGLPG